MVPEIKKILYTTDLSETSNFAFSYAASLADRYDAVITILHVLKDAVPTSESLVTNVLGKNKWRELLDRSKTEIVEKVRRRLENFCEETKAALPSCPFMMEEVIIKIGNPVEEIIREVNKNDYDMVVMGAHGHGVIADAVMGSVSRRVIRRCRKPVLVIHLPKGG
ncbi:MAG: universal stress protein [Desulfobacterales bacterium]|nr:MAG: universal stress protein [Desulfobacterales bacterium]